MEDTDRNDLTILFGTWNIYAGDPSYGVDGNWLYLHQRLQCQRGEDHDSAGPRGPSMARYPTCLAGFWDSTPHRSGLPPLPI